MQLAPPAAHRLRIPEQLAAVLVFSALAVWSTYPLILRPGDAVPGVDPGDNLASLWNTWSFHQAVQSGTPVYRTSGLFAPLGTQLSLHTHATTHSLLAWPWTLVTTVAAAHNLALLIGLTLNGICAFLLAHLVAGRFLPALAAGWIFAASGFVQVHLLGHMNLVHAWVLPLFALTLLRFTRRPTVLSAAGLGTAAAITLYTDYYFSIYCILIALTWASTRVLAASVEPSRRRFHGAGRLLLAIAALALVAAVAIGLSGGTVIEAAGVRVSLRSARNPLTVAWLLALAGAICLAPARPRVAWRGRPDRRFVMLTGVALVICAALTFPLGRALVEVIRAGDYASPRILWRSSPPGADIVTLVLGHPRHVLTGSYTTADYAALGIDVIEQSLWLGFAPMLMLVAWRRHWFPARDARIWLVLAVLFLVLSLGPFLRVAGRDTGVPLPHAALRYVPVVSNARMPGRAVVVVQLAVAMLLAVGWSRRRPPTVTSLGLLALVLLDAAPGPSALYRLPAADRVDAELSRASGSGAVVELPTGVRDGLGQVGDFDHRALVHQMTHGRPLAGGFVARLSPSIATHYEQDPVLRRFVQLSQPDGTAGVLPADMAVGAAARGLPFVVVSRDRLPEDRLSRAALESAGFRFVLADGTRELFASPLR